MLNKFWGALGTHCGRIEMCNGLSKIEELHIQPTSRWSGSTIDSLIGWSACATNPIGLCIHPIWRRPDLYLWKFLKDNIPQSIAELKMAINHKIPAIPKKCASGWVTTLHDVSLAQWRSSGTRPEKNASFKLETSNKCFFNCHYISFLNMQS